MKEEEIQELKDLLQILGGVVTSDICDDVYSRLEVVINKIEPYPILLNDHVILMESKRYRAASSNQMYIEEMAFDAGAKWVLDTYSMNQISNSVVTQLLLNSYKSGFDSAVESLIAANVAVQSKTFNDIK